MRLRTRWATDWARPTASHPRPSNTFAGSPAPSSNGPACLPSSPIRDPRVPAPGLYIVAYFTRGDASSRSLLQDADSLLRAKVKWSRGTESSSSTPSGPAVAIPSPSTRSRIRRGGAAGQRDTGAAARGNLILASMSSHLDARQLALLHRALLKRAELNARLVEFLNHEGGDRVLTPASSPSLASDPWRGCVVSWPWSIARSRRPDPTPRPAMDCARAARPAAVHRAGAAPLGRSLPSLRRAHQPGPIWTLTGAMLHGRPLR